ncbi:c-type cytochrome [Pseudomonas nitroreducens]|uniref:Cytochrome C n=1 Tax=Pseudomonas nitroreducens TaxID=46680 RepID=A0A246F8W5_PSENT|nr:c-type cytochrome [Pseudomonas nitroreducens]OWP50078.1 cytochrome C [Pseudomonas nitroreducens]
MKKPRNPSPLALAGLFTGALLLADLAQAASCDAAPGQRIFENKCSACHALGEDRVGPHLSGVVGRRVGAVAGYTYSADLAGAGTDWSLERLDQWLSGPARLYPGTTMAFGGIRNPADRQALLCFLQQQH